MLQMGLYGIEFTKLRKVLIAFFLMRNILKYIALII